jgi:CheY-like chemotaxis protein
MSTTSARKILIVEDNPDAGAALQKLLEADGHRVEWVANGREGLERLVAMQPEVALLDIGLPDLDGYEIARRTRAALGAAPLLVALTGYGQAQDRRDALDAGFDHHMTKPVDLDALRSLLRGQVRTAA